MWTCSTCGTKVDGSFEVCWSCGTSTEGVADPSFVRADEVVPDESPLETDMPAGEAPVPEPVFRADADLVEAYWALDAMQAKFLADQLSEDGIPALADTHDMHDALGSMSSAPRVRVRAEDLEKARAWLDAYDRQHKADHPGVD